MNPMERLIGVVAAGFLFLGGLFLCTLGDWISVPGLMAVFVGAVILIYELARYMYGLPSYDGSETKKEETDDVPNAD